jgi:hypothetical protein
MAALTTGDGLVDVVVAAIASTSPFGEDGEETWQRLLEGRSGIRALSCPAVEEFDLPVRIGAPLQDSRGLPTGGREAHAESGGRRPRVAASGQGRGHLAVVGKPIGCRGHRRGVATHRARRSRHSDVRRVETTIEAVPVAAYSQLGMLSTKNDDPTGASRPFGKDRDGIVFGYLSDLLLLLWSCRESKPTQFRQ